MKKTWLAWISYIVLRLAFFVVPMLLLIVIGIPDWLAAILAAFIGLALSVLLLARQRGAASETIYNRRNRREASGKRDAAAQDAAEEDELIDAGEGAPEPTETAEVLETAEVEPDPEPSADPDRV